MIIAVEGMDGSGKSTVAKQIAEIKNLKYINYPMSDFFVNSEVFYTFCRNLYKIDEPALKAWFFGMGSLYSVLNNKNDIVLDRHILSNYFWNGSEKTDVIFESILKILGKPDLTIILYASPKVRMQRLRERDPNDRDLNDPEKQVLGYDKMIKCAKQFEMPHVIIDTENKNVESIVQNCIFEINKIERSLNK